MRHELVGFELKGIWLESPESLFEFQERLVMCNLVAMFGVVGNLGSVLVVVGSSSLDGSVWYELAVLCCRVLLDFRLACQLF